MQREPTKEESVSPEEERRDGIEEIWSARLLLVAKQASFAMDRSSFGQDEVNAMLVQANPFEVSPAFYVIVDGFTPAELGITAGDLSGAPLTRAPTALPR